MQGETSNYHELITRLDAFIRKYYTNKLIRGALYWVAVSLLIFLAYSLLEHNFYFSKGVRKFLFFSFLLIAGAGFIYWIVNPVLKVFSLGSRIGHEQAAQIIGEHFSDVRDKLLNVLQLHKQAGQLSSPELALASVEQKTESIRLVPFRNAIDLGSNRTARGALSIITGNMSERLHSDLLLLIKKTCLSFSMRIFC